MDNLFFEKLYFFHLLLYEPHFLSFTISIKLLIFVFLTITSVLKNIRINTLICYI